MELKSFMVTDIPKHEISFPVTLQHHAEVAQEVFRNGNIWQCLGCGEKPETVGVFIANADVQKFWPQKPGCIAVVFYLVCATCQKEHENEITNQIVDVVNGTVQSIPVPSKEGMH